MTPSVVRAVVWLGPLALFALLIYVFHAMLGWTLFASVAAAGLIALADFLVLYIVLQRGLNAHNGQGDDDRIG